MKTRELRIGNYLNYKNTQDLAIVHLINGEKHYDCRDEYGFTPNGNYEPIKITEDWLIKFGFKKKEFDKLYPKERHFLYEVNLYHTKQELFEGYIVSYENTLIRGVRYVHELQNLYFCLTGNELI